MKNVWKKKGVTLPVETFLCGKIQTSNKSPTFAAYNIETSVLGWYLHTLSILGSRYGLSIAVLLILNF